ncbi:MAG: oligosaccharide flippase family protein [Cyclobacteriaceae bacterium]|nr:oligosaccharide flippase family protein [Cyclobacteriaceae bacterium HetDA_MAG_MS6]
MKALGAALSFVLHAITARLMEPNGYGIFALIISWSVSISLLTKGGFEISSIKFISIFDREKESSKKSGFLILSYVFCFSILLILTVLLIILRSLDLEDFHGGFYQYAPFVLILVGLISLEEINSGILRGIGKLYYGIIPNVILYPTFFLGIVLFSKLILGYSVDVYQVTCFLLLSHFFVVLVQLWPMRLVITSNPKFEVENWFTTTFPLFISNGAQVLLREIDIIIVGIVLGPYEAGIYAAAVKLIKLLRFGLSASNFVVAPMYSQLASHNNFLKIQETASKAVSFSFLISLPLVLGLLLFGEVLLSFFGNEFLVAIPILYILIIGEIFNILSGPNGVLLEMTGYQKKMMNIEFFSLFLNATLLYFITQAGNIIGAAIATSISILVRNLIVNYSVIKHMKVNPTLFSKSVLSIIKRNVKKE